MHGSAGPKLAKRDTTNATCYTCHAEKRGPFVHNHEPVQDNCASCHNPHGSNVAGMLKARDPILCNQCHTPHIAGGVGAVGGQPGVFPPAVPPQTVVGGDAALERHQHRQHLAGPQLPELPHAGARLEQPGRAVADAAEPVPLSIGETP